MTETYIKDLCQQLDSIASISYGTDTVYTKSGKVYTNTSYSGSLWRKFINTEEESRKTTVQGIEQLLDTVNDLVSSKMNMPKIYRNITVSCTKGKVVDRDSKQNSETETSSSSSSKSSDSQEKMIRAESLFFDQCNKESSERLRSISVSLKNSCKGISVMLSKRYHKDNETVSMLLDLMNYATLISERIDKNIK